MSKLLSDGNFLISTASRLKPSSPGKYLANFILVFVIIIFFISLLTGSLASIYLNSAPHVSVGASGAIFGLFGAFIALGKRLNQGARDIYVIVGLNFVFGFILGGVDWRAHLGGLVGGYLTTAILLRITRL